MEILTLSLPRVEKALTGDSVSGRRGINIGRFRSRPGIRIGDQRWPHDYLVVVLEGRVTAHDGASNLETLSPGEAALWHANEYWRLDVIDDCAGVTFAAEDLDQQFLKSLQPICPSNSDQDR